MDILHAFPQALKKLLAARSRDPKVLQTAISATHLRYVERGLKSPTLRKVERIARELDLQPLTVLLATYAEVNPDDSLQEQLGLALQELSGLGLAEQDGRSCPISPHGP